MPAPVILPGLFLARLALRWLGLGFLGLGLLRLGLLRLGFLGLLFLGGPLWFRWLVLVLGARSGASITGSAI